MVSNPLRAIREGIAEGDIAVFTGVHDFLAVVLYLAQFSFFCVGVDPWHKALTPVAYGGRSFAVRAEGGVRPKEARPLAGFEQNDVAVWSKALVLEDSRSNVCLVMDKKVL